MDISNKDKEILKTKLKEIKSNLSEMQNKRIEDALGELISND